MKKAKQSQSLKQDHSTLSEQQQTQTAPERKSLNIYRSINKLPLWVFIDVLVDGNLLSLVVGGAENRVYDVDEIIELQTTWANLLQEYSEAIGNNDYKFFVSLYKEVSILEITLSEIFALIKAAQVTQLFIQSENFIVPESVIEAHKKTTKKLNQLLTTNCKFNYHDPITYAIELEKCSKRTTGIKMRYDMKLAAFTELQKKQEEEAGKGAKMDRAWFDKVLITLSDHAKFDINEHNITVSKFCERIKRYNDHYNEVTLKKKTKNV